MKTLIRQIFITLLVATFFPAMAKGNGFIRFMARWSDMTKSIMSQATGYIPLDSMVGLGPVSSFVGYNTLEGFRLGGGLATTVTLSPRLGISGYGGYGFRDHRWKYGLEAEWHFIPAKGYFDSYRVNAIKTRAGYDTYALGDDALAPERRRTPIRLAFRRNEMILYRQMAAIGYIYEPTRRSSIEAGAARERLYPTRYLSFGPLATIDAWRLTAEGMWRPRGDFFQATNRRIDTKPMALRLRARLQWVEGASSHDNTSLAIAEITADKVTPIGGRGATVSILAHGAYTAGHGLFPLLPTLPTSPYVICRFGAFAMLRPMELGADRYVDLHTRIDDGGLLLGMIDAIKPLGISLTASAGMATGGQYCLRGASVATAPLRWSHPYGEAGVGLDHILGIGRIEYVWRLSYRHIPGARRNGIAIGIDFSF
ncbi:MAG: hypothetical protein NC342_06995 [Pseudoflavonifractor sp.]|nr:hypothetical protein [Alloprevotella sp.]MCM1117264.1 hypothetical protein [Pseudoflavonifractor sp.]